MSDAIELNVLLPIPREKAWSFLTDAKHLQAWFGPHVSLEPRPGGAFRETWSDEGRQVVTSGRVEQFRPPETIAWSWADDDWTATTRLSLALTERGAETEICLLHSGWSAFPAALGDELRRAHEVGWRKHLESLARYAAGQAS